MVATDGSLSSVDPATGEPWTTWPTWPSFLPIIREMLVYAAAGQHNQRQLLVGMPISGTFHTRILNDVGANLRMIRPDKHSDGVPLRNGADGWQWIYDQTYEAGCYTLVGAMAGDSQQFAVNVDTTESDLAKVAVEVLPPEVVVRNSWTDSDAVTNAGLIARSGWDRSLLWAAFGLLFLESSLAWLFGRGAT
jgi:hypothetical protein